MNWDLVLNYGLKILGSAAATLIITLASILFAKIKNKIGEARLNTFIDKAVRAAEQLYPNLGQKTGKEKYEYVLNQVLTKFPNMTNNEHLKALIEGAVYSVSEEVKQIAKANGIEVTSTQVETLKFN